MDDVSLKTEAARYTEEVAGIFSLQLYEPRDCEAVIVRARDVGAWARAAVSVFGDDGQFATAHRPETRRASAFTPADDSVIMRDFSEKLGRLVRPAVKELWRVDLTRHSGTHVVRYEPGNYYAAHTDTGMNLLDRYFTVLCYLNDDFEGGQTSFPTLLYSAAPRRGKAVVFPSTYVHRADPVTRGEKYVIVSWMMGAPPSRWL